MKKAVVYPKLRFTLRKFVCICKCLLLSDIAVAWSSAVFESIPHIFNYEMRQERIWPQIHCYHYEPLSSSIFRCRNECFLADSGIISGRRALMTNMPCRWCLQVQSNFTSLVVKHNMSVTVSKTFMSHLH